MVTDPKIKSIKITFDIIDVLTESEGMGVSEVADAVDKPQSTAHDYLKSLEAINYVVNEDGVYKPSTRFLELGERTEEQFEIIEIARPELKELAEDTGEHTVLMGEEFGLGTILAIEKGDKAVRITPTPGQHVRLHTTSIGKSILSTFPRTRIEEIIEHHGLPQVNEKTTTDPEVLYEELAEIRDQGYSMDAATEIEGMMCVAAPISVADHSYGIGLCGPTHRLKNTSLEDMATTVRQYANVIEVNFSHR